MGYGVIETKDGAHRAIDWGVIETTTKTALASRLRTLYDGICTVIDLAKPEAVAFEALIFAQNVQSALALGQARGVALLAASQRGIEVIEYSPKEIKLTIAGRGSATKDQVVKMVRVLLGLREETIQIDAGDALAVALSHALAHRRRALISGQTFTKPPRGAL